MFVYFFIGAGTLPLEYYPVKTTNGAGLGAVSFETKPARYHLEDKVVVTILDGPR
jgi:hypothetical protein